MISTVEITRIANKPLQGMFGAMKIDSEPFCVTLEPPDKDNQRNISCIPPGQYICHRYSSDKYGNTWQVMFVPGRSYVLFHAGNVVSHTKGCILTAQHYGKLYGNLAVLNSGRTFSDFMRKTETCSELYLTIRESF